MSVAHRSVEIVIGRLLTDDEFRTKFTNDPRAALFSLSASDLRLNLSEIAALMNTDPEVWAEAADGLDPRLQKARLTVW